MTNLIFTIVMVVWTNNPYIFQNDKWITGTSTSLVMQVKKDGVLYSGLLGNINYGPDTIRTELALGSPFLKIIQTPFINFNPQGSVKYPQPLVKENK